MSNHPGNDAWKNFSRLFMKQWLKFDRQELILNMVDGNEELAMVVSQISNEPEKWLVTKIPALNGKTPIWCKKNQKSHQLKTLLMNMPW